MHALYIAMCNIGSDLPDWPAFQSQLSVRSPHLGPGAGVRLSLAIAAPRDWWQLFTDEAVFIIPVQGCTDQMDPDHPSTVRDTSVPVVAQSTNKSPAPWKAAVSHRGMDAAACCLLKTKEKYPQNHWVFVPFWCLLSTVIKVQVPIIAESFEIILPRWNHCVYFSALRN